MLSNIFENNPFYGGEHQEKKNTAACKHVPCFKS